MPFHANRIASIVLLLNLCACGHPPADGSSGSAGSQSLPFDRRPRSTGILPSTSLVPSATKLPEGTAIPSRLQSALSSATAHAGDTFYAVVDEPVVIDGQTLVEQGAVATGRVLEAKPFASSVAYSPGTSAGNSGEPGYLRIVLVSLKIGEKPIAIETSSIFAKGGSREDRNSAAGVPSGATITATTNMKTNGNSSAKDRGKDILFSIGRRLNFRLAQTVDLQ